MLKRSAAALCGCRRDHAPDVVSSGRSSEHPVCSPGLTCVSSATDLIAFPSTRVPGTGNCGCEGSCGGAAGSGVVPRGAQLVSMVIATPLK